MPNHIHGIITITDAAGDLVAGAGFPRPMVLQPSDFENGVLIEQGRGNPAPTIGNMIAWFKYKSTVTINKIHGTAGRKLWQRNYYEHIIRDGDDYQKIATYVVGNPRTWDSDNLYQKQLREFVDKFA